MDLQISVFLLLILFTGGHSLSCYQCMSLTGQTCAGQTKQTCPSGFSQCMSYTIETTSGGNTTKQKMKGCVPEYSCQNNISTAGISVFCCNTDLCNAKDAEFSGDSSSNVVNVPNGKKCYYCLGYSCSHIMDCSGSQDRCITGTVTSEHQSVVTKSCASKALCDAVASDPNIPGISCCEGNLCNGAQSDIPSSTFNGAPSVSQSFLFLCCSLLSYFLLH